MIILFFLLIILATVGLMYLLFQLLVNVHPSKNRILADLHNMKGEIAPWVDELIPWKKEELELLSLNQVRKTIKKGIVTTVKGVFTSIYDEPMIAYTYRQYRSAKKNAILYARTAHRKFVYRMEGEETIISIDNQVIGTINANGQLIAGNGRQLLAQIQRNVDELTLPVLINGKEVAGLLRTDQTNPSVNTRAFEFTTDMEKREEALMLSLAILEMAKKEID